MSDVRKSRLSLLFLAVFLVVLASWRPLTLPDEGRYADVGRWMLITGDWLTPRLNGIPFFHKPPLLYWLQTVFMEIFGVSAWCIRLVPAMHAMLMLLALYLAARKIGGERLALHAIWVLGSSLTFLAGGQFLNHDILVASWISIALWSFAGSLAYESRPNRRLALLGFAACGFAVLSKGLIGIVLPGLVMLIWVSIRGLWREVWRWPWIAGLALFLAIGLPWFVAAQIKYPDFFDYMIIGQHFRRYAGSDFNQHQAIWFYPACLAVMLFPWAFLPLRDVWQGLRQAPLRHLKRADAWQTLLWVWLVTIVAFFSVPQSKLIGYIFPAMPALALLAARSWEKHLAPSKLNTRLFIAICLMNLTLGVTFDVLSARSMQKKSSADVAHALNCLYQDQDVVMSAHGYPYDLSFEADLKAPLIVIQDWSALRRQANDNWSRELYEGSDFEPQTAHLLQELKVLSQPPSEGQWLVTPITLKDDPELLEKWRLVVKGQAWLLWGSPVTDFEARRSLMRGQTACANVAKNIATLSPTMK